jgi:hypothetical protein
MNDLRIHEISPSVKPSGRFASSWKRRTLVSETASDIPETLNLPLTLKRRQNDPKH